MKLRDFSKYMDTIRERMKKLESSFTEKLSSDEIKKLSKEYTKCQELLETYRKLLDLEEEIELWKEEDENEAIKLEREKDKLLQQFFLLVLPEENRKGNVIMEIRAGTGGEEAALFAADLFKMYSKYAEKKGWKVEIVNFNETDLGGFKEIVFFIKGKDAFRRLKYESGVHRVQRIPVTESGDRIHTSAATVVVLPEIEEVEIEIKPEDLKIETFRASGKGGQYVNKTESAVRITHIPTGITVSCQNERSQYQNKQTALKILRARLYQFYKEKTQKEISVERKKQIGTGDRSEKIRTYNFPQNRVTDHRINYTSYRLDEILNGDLDEIINKLLENELISFMENIKVL